MSIKLSEKHGLNPSISQCFFCGKDKNELVIFGRLPQDKEAPRKAVINHEPCEECKKLMDQGVMLCEVRKGSDRKNPDRTGNLIVIKEDVAQRIFNGIGSSRFAFIESDAWDKLNFPRVNNDTQKPS